MRERERQSARARPATPARGGRRLFAGIPLDVRLIFALSAFLIGCLRFGIACTPQELAAIRGIESGLCAGGGQVLSGTPAGILAVGCGVADAVLGAAVTEAAASAPPPATASTALAPVRAPSGQVLGHVPAHLAPATEAACARRLAALVAIDGGAPTDAGARPVLQRYPWAAIEAPDGGGDAAADAH